MSKETFRYWKKDLPALGGAQAQRPRFSAGDLLATAVVKRLTEISGIPVSRIGPVAEDLYIACGAHAWPQLERMSAIFLLETDELKIVSSETSQHVTSAVLVLPLRPIVNALREQLHQAEFDVQASLVFPPFAIARGGKR